MTGEKTRQTVALYALETAREQVARALQELHFVPADTVRAEVAKVAGDLDAVVEILRVQVTGR